MYKYNLKLDPELARQRHNAQAREWYKRNKDKVIANQRQYRIRKYEQMLINKGIDEAVASQIVLSKILDCDFIPKTKRKKDD